MSDRQDKFFAWGVGLSLAAPVVFFCGYSAALALAIAGGHDTATTVLALCAEVGGPLLFGGGMACIAASHEPAAQPPLSPLADLPEKEK